MLAAVVFVAISWLDDTARHILIWKIQQKTSLQANVNAVHFDVPQQQGSIKALQLFTPQPSAEQQEANALIPAQFREVASIDAIDLQVSSTDLLYRRQRVETASVSGITVRVGNPDDNTFAPDVFWKKLGESVPDLKSPLSDSTLDTLMKLDAKQVIPLAMQKFKTTAEVQKLRPEWERDSRKFNEHIRKIQELVKQSQTLKNAADNASPSNVANQLQLGVTIAAEVNELRKEIAAIYKKGNDDFKILENAMRLDEEQIKKFSLPIFDTQSITDNLLKGELENKYQALFSYIRSVQSFIERSASRKPNDNADKQGKSDVFANLGINLTRGTRGKRIHFLNRKEPPNFEVAKTLLDGTVMLGAVPVYFIGTVNNFAIPVESIETPIVMQFRFSGEGIPDSPILSEADEQAMFEPAALEKLSVNVIPEIIVKLIIDNDNGILRERLIIQCPVYNVPAQMFGDPDNFAINVSSGLSSLQAVLELTGEQIKGSIVLEQKNVRIKPVVPRSRLSTLGSIATTAFENVNTFHIELQVDGTYDEPVYRINSNIAEKLSDAIQIAMSEKFGDTSEQLRQALKQEHNAFEQQIKQMLEQLTPAFQTITNQQGTAIEETLSAPAVQHLLDNKEIKDGAKKLEQLLPGLLNRGK
jgi:hypothetical protein